ncbi:MAG: Gfo/Idh/MocA family oxidoreductase [Verrucomicrobiota bacterium]
MNSEKQTTNRRDFLKTSATLTGAALTGALLLERSAHAAGSDVIKIGLIGCGGRGTGAAVNAMNAGKDVRLVAIADIFEERLRNGLAQITKAKPEQVEVKDDHCFVGFDGYEKVIASGVDVVLITPASHFIPQMLKAAIDAGKHAFCEKPHGIDIPGVAICEAASEAAKKKNLSLVSGLCWRYDTGVRETMKRVHDGAIGDIVAIQENYLGTPYYPRERQPGQNEMQYQLWNWYHFNWLSGDQTAQQLVHSLDKASWALGDKPPQKLWGMGGRQTCLAPEFGDQLDHQAVVFEYPNGVRVYGFTRDQKECYVNTSDFIIGTKGRCDLLAHKITGETNWKFDQKKENMYDLEHRALFDSIRAGKPINNGHYMCLSTRLGVAAQMACYTGTMIGWEDAMQSKRSFALPRYGWDVEPPVKPGPDGRYSTAMQGNTELDKWLK